MIRNTLASAMVLLALATATLAQQPAPKPDETPAPSGSLAQKVKQDPNDIATLRAFFSEQFGAIGTLLRTDAAAAEKKLAALKQEIESMAPTKEEAKTLLQGARSAVTFYEGRIALARVTLAEVADRLKANADDPDTLMQYLSKIMEQASASESEPAKVRKVLGSAREFLNEIKAKAREETRPRIDQTLARLSMLESSLTAGERRDKLVGQKAAPLAVETWVNGSPLSDDDLKGKVVLLDFWAVWCGPCIATFPHLREWNEKYADKGLVILGVTNYYNYDWDEKADKATRSQGKVAPETEQAMLVKFAAQHKLAHRFGIEKDRALSKAYGVTGIPQAVVIDRDGVVRLIKVGSGDENAKAIGDLLETLVATGRNAGE